jgi:hypothetical protein
VSLDPHTFARALGGEANGNIVRAPSPGQKPSDRSLKIKISDDLSDGFSVIDFYGTGDWRDAKDYVRSAIGAPWEPQKPDVNNVFGSVARMNARANGATVLDFNTAGPQREKKSYTNGAKVEPQLGPIVETYDYTDADGTLLYQVTRHDPKDFRQRRPDGNDGWIDNLDGVRRVLYRLPYLARFPDVPVFICEGEKDADRLASLGYCTTTVSAGDWDGVDWDPSHRRKRSLHS